MINKIINLINRLKISFYLLRFSIVITLFSDNTRAKQLITRARWRISQIEKDEQVKKLLLDFIKDVEKSRFPNKE